jgi:hypothetical protein
MAATPVWELLSREKGFRKWRVPQLSGFLYVVICKPCCEARTSRYVSADDEHWASASCDELRGMIGTSV